jgi:hypothetical protein
MRLEKVRQKYYEKAVEITTRKITSLINNISYLENIPENQDFSELDK